MTDLTKKILTEFKSYVLISVGLIIYSFGWMGILMPAKVIGGGMTGVGQIIYFLTSVGGEEGIPVGLSFIVINVVLLAVAVFIIGPKFGIKAIYGIFFYSFALGIMQKIIPEDLMGLQDDKLLSSILGGGLAGIGIAICFMQGGSTGGTDIIALIINKYRSVSLGRIIMMCDVFIIGSTYFVFHNISSIIYGYITIAVVGYTIDFVMQGTSQSCQLFIISKYTDEIAPVIIGKANRGLTILHGEGGYTGSPQKILMVYCRRTEIAQLCKLVRDVDNNAFISNSLVSNVYGNGFDELKLKKKKNG
ncbi:MAG: YitT family protein [Rikenellaceae bacterium]